VSYHLRSHLCNILIFYTISRHPDELYKNGIQRSSFLPTIELLKTRFKVTPLDSGTDYRQEGTPVAADHSPYHHPLSAASARALEKVFEIFAPGEKIVEGRKLPLWGRSLRVPHSTEHIAKFTFHDLCASPLSASDYLTVTGTFGTLVVENIPKMGLNERDMARRFINLIDGEIFLLP
jgi:peroxisome-assembly ATPase